MAHPAFVVFSFLLLAAESLAQYPNQFNGQVPNGAYPQNQWPASAQPQPGQNPKCPQSGQLPQNANGQASQKPMTCMWVNVGLKCNHPFQATLQFYEQDTLSSDDPLQEVTINGAYGTVNGYEGRASVCVCDTDDGLEISQDLEFYYIIKHQNCDSKPDKWLNPKQKFPPLGIGTTVDYQSDLDLNADNDDAATLHHRKVVQSSTTQPFVPPQQQPFGPPQQQPFGPPQQPFMPPQQQPPYGK